MRNLILVTLFFIANAGISQTDTVATSISTDTLPYIKSELQELKNDASTFAMGRAESGIVYFQGVLAGIVLADLDIRRFDALDEQNAPVADFVKNGESCLMHIAALRESMTFYTNAGWPLSAKFHELTIAWLDCVEGLVKNHYFKLGEAFSKADEDMTDEEWDLYEEFYLAQTIYFEVDQEWVDFQFEFAEANGFEIGFLIDEDAMLETEASE